jgi:hypothetical protein
MTTTFLYTIPQWFVFAALFMIIYGWVEQKKAFRLIGISFFTLFGAFAMYVLLGDYLDAGDYLTPAEIAAEELDDEIINEIPIEAQILPAYLCFIASAILAIPSFILDWKDKKYSKLLIVLTALTALAGFFIIVGAVRTA